MVAKKNTGRAQTMRRAIMKSSECDTTCFGALLVGMICRKSNKNGIIVKPTPQKI